MVIAVDVDDVLYPFVPLLAEWHNKMFPTDFKTSDFFSYSFNKVWGGTREQAIHKVHDFHLDGGLSGCDRIMDSFEVLGALKKEHRLVSVTSRPKEFEKATLEYIESCYPGIFDMVMLCNHYSKSGEEHNKADKCLELGAELIIDDSVKYTIEASQKDLKAILFGSYPWNKTIQPLPENVRRADNWKQVPDVLASF